MRALLAAIQFLTVVPVRVRLHERNFEHAPSWFPLVGLFIGSLTVLGSRLLEWVGFSDPLLGILSVALLAAWSGGLHLDGLADMADGFLSARPRDRVLEIMRDSRIGTMGVLALVFVLAIKVAALCELSGTMRWRTLILAPLLGRSSIILAMRLLPYARASDGGLATVFSRRSSHMAPLSAVLSMIVASSALLGIQGGSVCLVVTGVVTWLMVGWSWRRIGGFTGDTLGATSEVVEVTVLLVASAWGRLGPLES